MQSALNVHSQRLRSLKDHFHHQQRFLTSKLQELQQQLDSWHETNGLTEETFRQELCQERDQLAAELSHVRMAIEGTNDELSLHEGHLRLLANSDPLEALAAEALAASIQCDQYEQSDQYELLGA